MSKNQTAVEYLVKELSAILGPLETKPMQDLLMVDAINKAKQMEEEQIMDTMCQQLQMEVNASETQKYYKSKEVQDLDNPTDVVDEYESMGNLDKMSIKNQNGFFAKPMLLAVISFFMRNLEFIPLCFALQFWFDAGNRWEYWVTVFLVGTFSGISTAYNKYNNY